MQPFEFIIFSDLHAHAHRRFSTTTRDGGNSRQETCMRCLRYVRHVSEETGIKNILFSGDLFDAKNRVPVTVIAEVMQEFHKWSQMGLQVWMIPGNHDFSVRSGKRHGLEIFDHLKGFHIFTEIYQNAVFRIEDGRSITIDAYPYRESWDVNQFQDRAERLANRSDFERRYPHICLIHGTLLSDRYTNAMGIMPDHEGLTNNDLIDESWLSVYDLSLIGHVHDPHRYKRDGVETSLLVPGCPWQQHPGDVMQRRGVWTCSWVDSGASEDLSLILHEVPGIPKFVPVPFGIGGIQGDMEVSPEGNIVLLYPEEHGITESTWDTFERWALDNGAVYVERMPLSEDKREKQATSRVNVNEKQTPEVVIKTAVESGAVDLAGFDETAVINKAVSFIYSSS